MSNSIDTYIDSFEGIKKQYLISIRDIIKKVAPDAIEKMSYKMPAFYLNGNLVYFAAQNKHLGFYPTGDAIKHFEDRLTNFMYSKGAIRFPYQESLPEKLIQEIVLYRVEENKNH